MKRALVCYILFVFGSFLFGQESATERLSQMHKDLYAKNQFSYRLVKQAVLEANDSMIQEHIVEFDANGDRFLKETSDELIVSDGDYRLIINKNQKAILLQKIELLDSITSLESGNQLIAGMDTLIAMSDSMITNKLSESKLELDLYYEEGILSRLQLIADLETGFYEKIIYHYRKPTRHQNGNYYQYRLEFSFLDLNFHPKFRTGYFSLTPYVKRNDEGVFELTDLYSDYILLQ